MHLGYGRRLRLVTLLKEVEIGKVFASSGVTFPIPGQVIYQALLQTVNFTVYPSPLYDSMARLDCRS